MRVVQSRSAWPSPPCRPLLRANTQGPARDRLPGLIFQLELQAVSSFRSAEPLPGGRPYEDTGSTPRPHPHSSRHGQRGMQPAATSATCLRHREARSVTAPRGASLRTAVWAACPGGCAWRLLAVTEPPGGRLASGPQVTTEKPVRRRSSLQVPIASGGRREAAWERTQRPGPGTGTPERTRDQRTAV